MRRYFAFLLLAAVCLLTACNRTPKTFPFPDPAMLKSEVSTEAVRVLPEGPPPGTVPIVPPDERKEMHRRMLCDEGKPSEDGMI